MKQPKIDEKLEAENDGREAEAMKLRSKSIRRLSVQRLEDSESEGQNVSMAARLRLWLPVTCVLGPRRCRWGCTRLFHTHTGGSGSTAQSDG